MGAKTLHSRISAFVTDMHTDLQINGTYINDRKIGNKRIREGDRIEFGDIAFIAERP